MPDTYNSKYTAAQIESFFDLLNSNSFITNTVSNLVNYYLKTELYTKTEIDTIVTNIKNSRFESVNVLPTENIKTNVIYLLPASNPKTNNIKDEYINIDGTTSGWENIGSTSVDLSNYVTLQALNNALVNYVTSSDLTTALENFTPSKEGTDDYSELDNKPSIENVTLDGNKSASDLGLAKSSDLVNKQDKIQVTTIPEASIDLLNKVIQYIGATTQDYIHNYYYECISDGESTPSYSWQQTNVQPSSGGGGSYTAGDGIDITNDVISTKQSEEGDIDEIIDVYPQAGNLVSIVNAFNRGDIYSTDEKMIGQWINGKPLYQCVYNLSPSVNIPANDWVDTTINSSGMETIVNARAVVIGISVDMLCAKNNTGTSKIAVLSAVAKTIDTLILQYTKTTDTAISIGEATEYSTTEKVVGTWIDGKPVFQRVFTSTAQISLEVNTWVSSEFSIANVDVIVDAGIIDTGGNRGQIWCGHNGDTLLLLSNRTNSWVAGAHLIVQYTKTTT